LQTDEKVAKAIVVVGVEEIERNQYFTSHFSRMRLALEQLANQGDRAETCLSGWPLRTFSSLSCTPLIKGDTKSYSIAAASILAKVYRDGMMLQYVKSGRLWVRAPQRIRHREHKEILRTLGPCPIHRKTFLHLEVQGIHFLARQ
jgi:ribonuclease HII